MDKKPAKKKNAGSPKKGRGGKTASELQSLLSLTQQAAREWRITFDATNDGIWMLDREHRIRRANKTSERMFQRPFKDMLGRHCWEIVHGTTAPVPECPVLRTKVSLRRERMNLAVGEKWFEVTADPILNDNGEYDGSVHIITDITERVKAEEQTLQMKRLYATLSQVNQTIVRAGSREKLFADICQIAVKFGGYSLAWIGLLDEESGDLKLVAADGMNLDKWDFPLVNVHREEYQPGVAATAIRAARIITSEDLPPGETPTPEMRRLYEAGYHSIASVPFRRQDKVAGVLILASSKNNLFKSEDELRLLDEIGLDVSFALDNFAHEAARKQAEIERQNFYETLNASLNEIYLFDAETLRFTFVSAGAIRNLGYTIDELREMTPLDLKPSVSAAAFEELIAPLRRREAQTVRVETCHRRANGSFYPVEIHLQFFDQPQRREFLAVILDITERKRAEEALRQSEERYRYLFENNPHPMWAYDLKTLKFLAVNDAAVEKYGHSRDEFMNMTIADIRPAEDVTRLLQDVLKPRPKLQRSGEWRHKLKDGRIIDVEITSHTLNIAGAEAALVVAQDITERKQAEAALRQSEREMRALLTSLDDIVFELDENGTYLNIWAANESLLAMPKAQLSGRQASEVMGTKQGVIFTDAIKRALTNGVPETLEYPLKVQSGERWFMARISPIFMPQGVRHSVSVLVRDITERVKNEKKLALKNRQLNALHQLGLALAQSLEILVICRAANQWIAQLADCPNFGISLFNEETRRLKALFVLSGGIPLDVSSLPELEFDETLPRTGRAKAVLEREIVVVSHMRRTAETIIVGDERESQAALYVPMILQGRLVGLLEMQSYLPDAYAEADLELFKTVANQIGLALENARLFQAAQEEIAERRQSQEQAQIQLRRLRALHEIDRAISASMDMRLSLDILLSETLTQLSVDAACVLLLNPSSQTLECAAAKGFYSTLIRESRIFLGQCLAGQAGMERKIVHAADLAASEKFLRRELLGAEKFVEYYGAPLVAKGLLKGVLEIYHRSPINRDVEWMNYLETLGGQAAIAIDNAQLFEGMQRSNFELVAAYDATIEGWSRAMDLRDKETEGHTLRVTEWTIKLAKKMGVGLQEITHIRRGALLHDIGKLGVPDHILHKPDKLDRIEWAVMRQHPSYAFNMLMPINYLRPAFDIPYCHHEKWDGSGYPRGLKGEEIPLAARIFAVVDVWDALRSDRPYRKGWDMEKIREHLLAESGKHFDPRVVEAFLQILDEE